MATGIRWRTLAATFALVLSCGLAAAAGDAPPLGAKDALLDALLKEMERSAANLKGKGDEPLYYLSYRVSDGNMFSMAASYGALTGGMDDEDPMAGRMRLLDVSARVGSPNLDNTHKVRGGREFGDFMGFGGSTALPIEDDPAAIRVAVWRATDRAYKAAVKQLIQVRTNKAVKVEEEDQADDFSEEKPHVHLESAGGPSLDRETWKGRLRKLSAIFKAHPMILSSSVSMEGGIGTVYFVDSDGARIREPRVFARLMIAGSVKADDGMDLDLYDDFVATSLEQLPTEAEAEARVHALIDRLEALRAAPTVEPYIGPAVIMNRAAAVFFHEIFGHRVEGHRQKDEEEGQTFTKKINQPVMPEFISVVDDPQEVRFGDTILNGHYAFDDEGVPAAKVALVERGILKGFLMGRSPIKGFPHSNGHGRAQPGMQPVARQGVIMVQSENQVPFADLRARLIEEVKKSGKPYGLMFQDISGGYTMTRRGAPQAFAVVPLVVYRVYPDGRPDELVRGVDLVGTPLASLEKILATGNDFAVFNGYCGAESGYVPVSAVAPSLLVAEMEVAKKEKGHDRPPLLAPPLHPGVKWPGPEEAEKAAKEDASGGEGDGQAAPPSAPAEKGGAPGEGETDVVFKALDDEIARARKLSMARVDKPYWLSAFANDGDAFSVAASFGALVGKGGGAHRGLSVQVRVGDEDLDNTNFAGGGGSMFAQLFGGGGMGMGGAPEEADYDALRQALWLQFDSSYKEAAEAIARKRAYLKTNTVKERPPDFGPAPVENVVLPREKLDVDKDRWTRVVKSVSAAFREHPRIYEGTASLSASVDHQYFVSTDPVRHRFAERRATVALSAETQAPDGMEIRASAEIQGRTEADLPGERELVEEAHRLARRVEALAGAPPARDYTGPVLFTGRAAGTFFLKTVGDPLSHARVPLGQPKQGRLVDRLGKRIASPLLTVRDDPRLREWEGKPLLGHFPVDDDGVKPSPITLIAGGTLKTYYMSRVPTEHLKETNGHSRAGEGSTGNLFVEAKETESREALKKRLIELAAEEDLEYGLLVEEFGTMGGFSLGGFDLSDLESFFGQGGEAGSIALPPPAVLYRVYRDGREELVRGATFKATTYRVLRDIVALGDDPTLLNTTQFGQRVSVVAPSVLVKGLELKKPREEFAKPPATPRPPFEEGGKAKPGAEKEKPGRGKAKLF